MTKLDRDTTPGEQKTPTEPDVDRFAVLSVRQQTLVQQVWVGFARSCAEALCSATNPYEVSSDELAALASDRADAMTEEWDLRFHNPPWLAETDADPPEQTSDADEQVAPEPDAVS